MSPLLDITSSHQQLMRLHMPCKAPLSDARFQGPMITFHGCGSELPRGRHTLRGHMHAALRAPLVSFCGGRGEYCQLSAQGQLHIAAVTMITVKLPVSGCFTASCGLPLGQIVVLQACCPASSQGNLVRTHCFLMRVHKSVYIHVGSARSCQVVLCKSRSPAVLLYLVLQD